MEVHLDAFFVAVEAWGSLRRRPMQGRTSASTGPMSLRLGRFGSHVGLVSAGPLRELRLEELQGYVVDTPLESEVLLHRQTAVPMVIRSRGLKEYAWAGTWEKRHLPTPGRADIGRGLAYWSCFASPGSGLY